eukprot:NODE_532_length_6386_cov_0.597264.p1 type:complete len:783 gc:universal NODE_532_length_6386_cov_0.597264:3878-1530(-)
MEAFLITNAIGIIGKMLPVLQQIKLVHENFKDADILLERLTRLNFILKGMEIKRQSTTTHHILSVLNDKLKNASEFIVDFADKHAVKKILLADRYRDKFIALNDELYKMLFELALCQTIDMKDNDGEMSGKLEQIMGILKDMSFNGSNEAYNGIYAHLNASASEMSQIKAMLEHLMNSKHENVTMEDLQATKVEIIEKSRMAEIDYIHEIIVDVSESIGSGSFGQVHLGQWNGLCVAVKVIKDVPFKNPGSFKVKSDALEKNKAILREVKAFEKLNKSPFIVKFYGVTAVEDNLGFVIEYVDNYTLYSWLYFERSLPNDQINKIQLGIARGLAYMHLNGIAHNDVKSNNIMIDSLYMPRIIDLGMAKITNSTVSTIGKNRTIGTDQWRAPEYWQMSPDNMRYRKEYPFAGDIYAFAIVLGEIATKIIPWIDFSSEDIKQAVCQGMRPYSNTDIKSPIFQFIEKCWYTNPQNRPDMTEIVNYLCSQMSEKYSYTKPNNIKNISPPAVESNPPNYTSSPINQNPQIPLNLGQNPTPNFDISNLYGLELMKMVKQSVLRNDSKFFIPLFVKLVKTIDAFENERFIRKLRKKHLEQIVAVLSSCHSNGFLSDELLLVLVQYYKLLKGSEIKSREERFNLFSNCSNNPYALLYLGRLTYLGWGTKKSKESAFSYFQQAANLKIPNGISRLGWCYENGIGCKKDKNTAMHYYKLSMDANCPFGSEKLGDLHHKYFFNKRKDLEYAYKCYSNGSKFGSRYSEKILSAFYHNGTGCAKNPEMSIYHENRY